MLNTKSKLRKFTKEDIYEKVRQIPKGYFSTYQAVAKSLGSPRGQQGVAKSFG